MDDLAYDLTQIGRRNRDGSQTTQYQRSRSLRAIATQLRAIGYPNMRAASLKPKHVTALVRYWQDQELSAATIKNRLAHVRWWADKVGKPAVVPKDNALLGIADRTYVTNVSQARELNQKLEAIPDARIRLSLELQRTFGLRREESIKIQPAWADRGDRLVLKDTWTKGGREREIPIATDAQRAVLDRAHKQAGSGSLIPAEQSYRQHLKRYEYQLDRAGLHKQHGLRHAYAQDRYYELTGHAAPAAGGPEATDLTPEQRAVDHQARLTISRELGHEREQITAVYLGR